MKKTGLVKQNTNIFYKLIKKFFRVFKKQKKEEVKFVENSKEKNINEFKVNIEVKQDTDKLRLLKLQKDFENGIITESQMDEQDIYELHELYNSQIQELEASTEKYKKRIIGAKRKLTKQRK